MKLPPSLSRLFHDRAATRDRRALVNAAGAGDIETLRDLMQRGVSWDEAASAAAAQNGHVPVLSLLVDAGIHPVKHAAAALEAAAKNGQLEVIDFLRPHTHTDQLSDIQLRRCEIAAQNGMRRKLKTVVRNPVNILLRNSLQDWYYYSMLEEDGALEDYVLESRDSRHRAARRCAQAAAEIRQLYQACPARPQLQLRPDKKFILQDDTSRVHAQAPSPG